MHGMHSYHLKDQTNPKVGTIYHILLQFHQSICVTLFANHQGILSSNCLMRTKYRSQKHLNFSRWMKQAISPFSAHSVLRQGPIFHQPSIHNQCGSPSSCKALFYESPLIAMLHKSQGNQTLESNRPATLTVRDRLIGSLAHDSLDFLWYPYGPSESWNWGHAPYPTM